MARSQSLRFFCLGTTALLLSILTSGPSGVQASQRSVHLDTNGLYRGLVVAFSSDFVSEEPYRANMLQNVMNNLQNASNILNELLGVQYGELTIMLPPGWSPPAGQVAEAQYRPLSEADIIFTDPSNKPDTEDKSQILTMQYGQCGEGALPINFPKMHLAAYEAPRLIAHQWLLYRYGVFNEFGYTKDQSYPVYYLPADGGLRNYTIAQINSCSNVPEFIMNTQCPNMTINPNTGLPNDLSCDVIPVNNSIQSSFLYSPTVVSQLKLCDEKTHDFLSPNKQNILCDYQSAQDVIRKHADFDSFKHVLKPNRVSNPIKFHFWQNAGETQEKSYILYTFPSGYKKGETLLKYVKHVTALSSNAPTYLDHQTKVRYFDYTNLHGNTAWNPANNIDWGSIATAPITEPVDLIRVLGQTLSEFQKTPSSRVTGTCVFAFSGKNLARNIDNEIAIDNLAAQFNSANVTLRVIIIEDLPRADVINFFDHLISKLVTSSSVNYALSPNAISLEQSQMFAAMTTVVLDAIQDSTEQTHILLKSESFQSAPKISFNFTLDETLSKDKYRLLIDVFTTGDAENKFNNLILTNNAGNVITYKSQEKSGYMRLNLYDGIGPGMYNFMFDSSETTNHWITVNVRALLKTNSFRSYEHEVPIVAKCWLVTDGQYPLRGYVQVIQGLNAPVHNVDVSLLVHRHTTGQPAQSFNIQLQDNGRGSPDITQQDGIYSAYLDQLIADNVDAVFSVQARIYSESGVSRKPANFGNTVMWQNKPRCCGSQVTSGDDVLARGVEIRREVNCGSFRHSIAGNSAQANFDNFLINDLQMVGLDADNRTVTLKWNSPFDSATKKYEVKAFYSIPLKSTLTMEIKEHFDQKASAELSDVTPQPAQARPQAAPQHYAPSYDQNQEYSSMFEQANVYDDAKIVSVKGPSMVTVHILQPEEGYYFLAVKERDNSGATLRQTKPSNIVPIYLKSNVTNENTSALGKIDSRQSEGPDRQILSTGGFTWVHGVILGVGILLLLVIIVIIAICVKQSKARQANKKQAQIDYEVKKTSQLDTGLSRQQQQVDPKYYMSQDASSLNSNDHSAPPASNVSNNTSCSSVNTVDNGNMMHPHLEAQQQQQQHQEQHRQLHNAPSIGVNLTPMGMHHSMQPHPNLMHTPSSHHSTNPSLVKELNVATLLPNSWDAKELLDHWGRVQEAKQRQESPPVMRMQTASPSIPSYGGSSLDNYNNHSGYHQFQPATVQQAHHYPHESGLVDPSEYQPPLPSPYSNAISILHHQQQQQQQQIRQYQPMRQWAEPSYTPTPMNGGAYDDNGLPEYSVVRKHHPNISQV